MTDDSRAAALHWLCTSLRRADRHEEAARVLKSCPPLPDVIENVAYLELVELYRGERRAEDLLASRDAASSNAARDYGLARWLIEEGRSAEGLAILETLVAGGGNAFGTIAAEADLARR